MRKYLSLFSLDSNNAENYVSGDMRVDMHVISEEVKIFWDKILEIIRDIINNNFNDRQKKTVHYLLNNFNVPEIASILTSKQNFSFKNDLHNYRNFYKNYEKMIEKIRKILAWSQEFEDLVIDECPDILKPRISSWILETREKFPKVKLTCPVCKATFNTKLSFSNHIIKRNSKNDKYLRGHLKFVKQQENKIMRIYKNRKKYDRYWVNIVEEDPTIFLGWRWIYKKNKNQREKRLKTK